MGGLWGRAGYLLSVHSVYLPKHVESDSLLVRTSVQPLGRPATVGMFRPGRSVSTMKSSRGLTPLLPRPHFLKTQRQPPHWPSQHYDDVPTYLAHHIRCCQGGHSGKSRGSVLVQTSSVRCQRSLALLGGAISPTSI